MIYLFFIFFFFNDTATPEIYTLSLHDALPISYLLDRLARVRENPIRVVFPRVVAARDRKSTRLNSSHVSISYAVFCLIIKRLLAHSQPCLEKFSMSWELVCPALSL